MRVSQNLLSFLCGYEGMRTSVYADSGGVRTIGCGHTGSGVKKGTITQAEAYALLDNDVERFEDCVNRNINAPITQSMFDAMVSLAFNVGCSGFVNTGIPALVNRRDYGSAADKWLKSNLRDRKGNYLEGLARRRRAEVDLFWQDGMPSPSGKDSARTTAPAPTGTGRQLAMGWWILMFIGAGASIYGARALVHGKH